MVSSNLFSKKKKGGGANNFDANCNWAFTKTAVETNRLLQMTQTHLIVGRKEKKSAAKELKLHKLNPDLFQLHNLF